LKANLEALYNKAAEADKAGWMAQIADVAGRLFSGEELAKERAAFEAREAAAQAEADRQAKLAEKRGKEAEEKKLREQLASAGTLEGDIKKKLVEIEKGEAEIEAKFNEFEKTWPLKEPKVDEETGEMIYPEISEAEEAARAKFDEANAALFERVYDGLYGEL
jgi:hypothetical protein